MVRKDLDEEGRARPQGGWSQADDQGEKPGDGVLKSCAFSALCLHVSIRKIETETEACLWAGVQRPVPQQEGHFHFCSSSEPKHIKTPLRGHSGSYTGPGIDISVKAGQQLLTWEDNLQKKKDEYTCLTHMQTRSHTFFL